MSYSYGASKLLYSTKNKKQHVICGYEKVSYLRYLYWRHHWHEKNSGWFSPCFLLFPRTLVNTPEFHHDDMPDFTYMNTILPLIHPTLRRSIGIALRNIFKSNTKRTMVLLFCTAPIPWRPMASALSFIFENLFAHYYHRLTNSFVSTSFRWTNQLPKCALYRSESSY